MYSTHGELIRTKLLLETDTGPAKEVCKRGWEGNVKTNLR